MGTNEKLLTLNDGNKMPIVGLGTYLAEAGVCLNSVVDAINCGYRHFDSAQMYGNQQEVGAGINQSISDGRITREEVFVVSKVWPTFYGSGRVLAACKQMLKEFGLQYMDLVLLHWPTPFADDDKNQFPAIDGKVIANEIDIVSVYRELEEAKRLGLTKSIGVSNFNSEQINRIVTEASVVPVTNQVECHPYLNQEQLLKFCREKNITLTAYCPLGRGGTKEGQPNLLEDAAIKSIANKYKKTPAQVVLRWQIQRGVAVIPKSVNRERIEANYNVFDFNLSDEEMVSINSLNRNHRFVKFNTYGCDEHKEWPFKIPY